MRRSQLKCIVIIILSFLFITSILIHFMLNQFYSASKALHTQSVNNTFLLVVITSAGQSLKKRNVIRSTWLTLSPVDSKHIFVIGDTDKNYDENVLQEEILLYGDILLLRNTSDVYDSLTTKVLNAFFHVGEIWKFRYLLKCDDDSFVRIENIVTELKTRFENVSNLYWGFFHGSARINRKGKWKETKWILCDRYLPYARGGGYVLSQSLVKFIARNMHYLV